METGKIFGIGFHKTGTTSLHQALRALGYRSVHGDPRFGPPYGDEGRTLLQYIEKGDYRLPTIDRYDAFSDNPYFSIWRQLDQEYPNSKFILTLREDSAWLNSCISFYRGRRIRPMRYWMFGDLADPSSSEAAKNTWMRAYQQHNASILEYFANRPNDLLVMRITEGEGWEKLCPFLQKPVPQQPFPSANPTKKKVTMRKRSRKIFKRLRLFAKSRLVGTGDRILGRQANYIISHPKAGRTWLALALGKLLEEHFGIKHHAVIEPYNYLNLNHPKAPRLIFTHLGSKKIVEGTRQFSTRNKRIVFLARDPRDMIVSYYHQMTKRKKKFKGDISAFVRDPGFGISKIVGFMNFFAENKDQCEAFLLVRYEDMHADFEGAMEKVCDFIGLEPESGQLKQIADWSRFDRMQERERKGYYEEQLTILNARDTEDVNTFKVRKGKVGAYDEELSAEDIQYLNEWLDAHLHPLFDCYRSTPG